MCGEGLRITVGRFFRQCYENHDGSQLSSFHGHSVHEQFNGSIGEEEVGNNQSVSTLPDIDPSLNQPVTLKKSGM